MRNCRYGICPVMYDHTRNDNATISWHTWRQYPTAYIPIPNTDNSGSGYRTQEHELHRTNTGSPADACIQQDADRSNPAMHTVTYKYKSQRSSHIGFLVKLMKLPMRFFDSKLAGDLIRRIEDHRTIEVF